jgi:hypothetical protein
VRVNTAEQLIDAIHRSAADRWVLDYDRMACYNHVPRNVMQAQSAAAWSCFHLLDVTPTQIGKALEVRCAYHCIQYRIKYAEDAMAQSQTLRTVIIRLARQMARELNLTNPHSGNDRGTDCSRLIWRANVY